MHAFNKSLLNAYLASIFLSELTDCKQQKPELANSVGCVAIGSMLKYHKIGWMWDEQA